MKKLLSTNRRSERIGDRVALSGLSFSQLSFAGNEIRFGNQTLAILTGFDTTTLTRNNFVSV